MQFMLLIYRDETSLQTATEAERTEMTAAFMAYTKALQESGVWCAGDRLRPARSATTLRAAESGAQVLDGPYADTKEQLGGYYLIETADLDVALSWAKRCPAMQYGTVEVRPVWPL
jgi:hypothetical protein